MNQRPSDLQSDALPTELSRHFMIILPVGLEPTTSALLARRSNQLSYGSFKFGVSPEATSAGFEPARAEPNGLAVHLLNHSDMMSKKIEIL